MKNMKKYEFLGALAVLAADGKFEEEKHPRAPNGQFGSGGVTKGKKSKVDLSRERTAFGKTNKSFEKAQAHLQEAKKEIEAQGGKMQHELHRYENGAPSGWQFTMPDGSTTTLQHGQEAFGENVIKIKNQPRNGRRK